MMIPVDEIVELDGLNMAIHFSAAGQNYDPKLRRIGLEREIREGAQFVLVRQGTTLIAYLEFLANEAGVIRIPSIQIHPQHGHPVVLKQLLQGVLPHLENQEARRIQSAAHPGNERSLRLHQKLGFRVVSSDKDRVRFETTGEELVRTLQRTLRKTKGSQPAH